MVAAVVVASLGGKDTSPVRAAGAYAYSPANVTVSRDRYPGHGMPSLAANPRAPRQLLGVAKLFTREGATLPFTFASVDNGATWRDNGPLPLPPGYTFGSSDATVAFSARGVGFVAAAAWGPTSGAIFIWRTADGGRSFAAPVAVGRVAIAARAGSVPVGVLPDQPRLAVDTTRGARAGTVYLAFSYLTLALPTGTVRPPRTGIVLTSSLDGGRSFAPPRWIDGALERPNVAVGPTGIVSVFYGGLFPAGPRLALVRSADGGRHFGMPLVIPVVPVVDPPPTIPWVRYWPSAATDPRDGTLYVTLCTTSRDGQHMDVVLTRSRDGGRTWSAPLRITRDGLGAQADRFQAQLAVTPTGIVYVSYLALARGRVTVFLARSTTQGASIQPGRRVSTVAFNPSIGTGDPWIGDYQGLAAAGRTAHLCWTDTRTGTLQIVAAAVAEG